MEHCKIRAIIEEIEKLFFNEFKEIEPILPYRPLCDFVIDNIFRKSFEDFVGKLSDGIERKSSDSYAIVAKCYSDKERTDILPLPSVDSSLNDKVKLDILEQYLFALDSLLEQYIKTVNDKLIKIYIVLEIQLNQKRVIYFLELHTPLAYSVYLFVPHICKYTVF